ncbi:hypothetical protein COOONC_12442 [Cooperia oncophora]
MLVNLVCCLAAVLGIPANLFVLVAIFYFRREMRTISNIYIGNLAVADLLFLSGTPIVITQSITKHWNFGSVVCKGFVCGNGNGSSRCLGDEHYYCNIVGLTLQ